MTDRFNGLFVVLEKDVRDDDAENLINAIKQMRGVLEVTGNVVKPSDFVAEARTKRIVVEQIIEATENILKK